MDLQFVLDTDGKHTAVIIPIEEWNNLTTQHQELKKLEKPQQPKQKLSEKYKGVFSKEDAKSFNEHTQQMRKEWDNI